MSSPFLLNTPPECCAGAACAGCLKSSGKLNCCSKCKRAWYCSTDCQAAHWAAGHKEACREAAEWIAKFDSALAARDTLGLPLSYGTTATIPCSLGIAIMGDRDKLVQKKDVCTMISSTPFCQVCFKFRQQLTAEQRKGFRCCPNCLWGWCCSEEHWRQHKLEHLPHCKTLAAMSGGSLLKQQHRMRFPNQGPIHYAPEGRLVKQQQQQPGSPGTQQQVKLPQSWPEYCQMREVPNFQANAWLCMTESLSVPLTAALAATKLYPASQLARFKTFVVHLPAAGDCEVEQVALAPVIEELMHLLPAVTSMNVILVGAGLLRNHEKIFYSYDKTCCPSCEKEGCSRRNSFYRGPYEEFAASPEWVEPHLVLGLNSGIGEENSEVDWAPALRVMLDRDLPCCFTAMQEDEVQCDLRAITAAGARVVSGPAGKPDYEDNPFSALLPYHDASVGPFNFYSLNTFMICFQGRITDAAMMTKTCM